MTLSYAEYTLILERFEEAIEGIHKDQNWTSVEKFRHTLAQMGGHKK